MYFNMAVPLYESLKKALQAFFQVVNVLATSVVPFDQHHLLPQIAIHTH